MKTLNEKAMLVSLNISCWTRRVTDKNVSDEVTTNKNASGEAGDWTTFLVPRECMKEVYAAYGNLRKVHKANTLPWRDDGARILPAAAFMDYAAAIRTAKDVWEKAVIKFVKDYPTMFEQSKKRLGELYNPAVMPTPTQIKGKFDVRTSVFPMPCGNDFRVKLNDKDVAAIRKEIETDVASSVHDAVGDVWNQMTELINKVQTTLKDPDKKFKNSLIGNLKDFCVMVPKFNLTEDKDLEATRKEVVARLVKLSPDDLRDDKKERKDAAKAAQDIMDKMKAFAR